jgi:DNA-3-methyladenine glycosylase I
MNQTAPLARCHWAGDTPLYQAYHDEEWGVPLRGDDRALFERMSLEAAQAGLSWITILRKREAYRKAFDLFDPALVARYDAAKIAALMANTGIVRNRLKIEAVIHNAQRFLDLQDDIGSISDMLWAYIDHTPIQNAWASAAEVPAETPLSRQISRDLKRHGFKFVGPTMCYAMMQAIGMVNDHTTVCFRHAEVRALF